MSEEVEEKEEAPPKKRGKMMVVILLAAVVLLLGGGAGAYFAGLLPGGSSSDAQAATGEQAQGDAAPEVEARDVTFVELPDLLVNINIEGKRLRFLKFAAALEVVGEDQVALVQQLVPRITDNLNLYLRALAPEEMSGAQGVYRIKRDLLARINHLVKPAEVRDVLIREMLVQ